MRKGLPRLILSLVGALVLTLLSYWLFNLPISSPLSYEKWILKVADRTGLQYRHAAQWQDSVVLIDLHYDKTFIPAYDDYGYPLGTTAITDRAKLLQLLTILNERGTYRYILLDVLFQQGDETPADSALFTLLDTMPRLVIPRHNQIPLADGLPKRRTAYVDYFVTDFESDFVKYPYDLRGHPTIPLVIYQELSPAHSTILSHSGLYYTDNNRLCRRSVFLNLATSVNAPYLTADTELVAHDIYTFTLGVDILGLSPTTDTVSHFIDTSLFDGRYVIFGDFQSDLHGTYRGSEPGALILFNAYVALLEGQHLVSPWLLVGLFLLFALLLWLMLGPQRLKDTLFGSLTTRRPLLGWTAATLSSFVTYSLLFEVLCSVIYHFTGCLYDFLTIAVILSLASNIYHYAQEIYNIRHQHQNTPRQ